MIYSMTGFGRGQHSSEVFDVTVEIKTVNNRYCDVIVKMPKKLTVFEDRIKNKVKGKLSRGRVEIYINFEEKAFDNYEVVPNFDVLDKYVKAYSEIKRRYELESDIDLKMLARLQDGIDVSYLERGEEEYWEALEPALAEALDKLEAMRRHEGEKLKVDIVSKIASIQKILGEIEKLSPIILESYKNRVKERISDLLEALDTELDMYRLANEVAVYADKTNINEEVVRIHSHLAQLEHILSLEEPVGRKLDFLIQELNREVNTIGSKSPDYDISNYVIDLKSELEQIREQVQNVE
ncbi:YicC/YloC family endoribonuclease [Fusibacter sp. JL298sf-3]